MAVPSTKLTSSLMSIVIDKLMQRQSCTPKQYAKTGQLMFVARNKIRWYLGERLKRVRLMNNGHISATLYP